MPLLLHRSPSLGTASLSARIARVNVPRNAVFLISDAHLGSAPRPADRQARLIAFLRTLPERAGHLYILGDLFDFWFEYRHAIPKGHFQVLRALADLIESGVRVAYLGGNHDFWCGSYLAREVGLQVHSGPIVVTHQHRRVFLAHGDGIGPGDTGYRMLKAVLRNRLAITLYRALHPDAGVPLAHWVSRRSRHHTHSRGYYLERFSRYVATPQYAAGQDAVAVGHVHDPLHLRDAQGRDFLILGDWIEHFTYAQLEGGQFRLLRDRPGEPPEEIPARPWPDARSEAPSL